jgi:hypothetical protein
MNLDLLFVSGAPGAGKSRTLETLLGMNSEFLVLDIDWLAESASAFAERDIYTDPGTWLPYGKLWFEILHSICRNTIQPIFFCPNSRSDIETFGKPTWCRDIRWLLLDCSDDLRVARLNARGWSIGRKQEAIADAAELRESISPVIDTGTLSPAEVASDVLAWAASVTGKR